MFFFLFFYVGILESSVVEAISEVTECKSGLIMEMKISLISGPL